ncbi:MAG TPA: TonB-dependent receptor [Steroidobacteraceae bacterium]|jgi:outer membrane receptor protein involved in Fe transport
MSVSTAHRRHGGVSRVSITVAAILASTVGALGASAASANGRVFHFDITPEPLSQALRTYAQICGQDVIFTESVVAGAGATSLVGDFTADDALSHLLAGTQLVVERSPSGALMIRRRQQASTDAATPGRSVRVAQAGSAAAADPPSADPAPADPSADPPAQAAAPAATPAAASPLTEVVVTGSRIASRSYTSDSPLVGVSAAQIAAAGQVSLDSALGQMPQFAAAQGQTETGDAQGATGFQGGQSYSDLRGLGPERTLVLLDGQRLVPTNPNGAVDLNVIPMAMIEGVDVITGGASAVYGSDAMAGVVNFRLRQHFHGIQVSYQHGATTSGFGPEDSVSVLMGGNFDHNRGNAVVDFEYNERGAITGADSSFFSNDVIFNRGVARGPEAIFNAGELGAPIPISAVNSVLSQYGASVPGTGNYGGYLGINGDGTLFTTKNSGNCVQNYRGAVGKIPGLAITPDCSVVKSFLGPYFYVQTPLQRYNLFSRVTYNVNDNVQAYGQINFMHSTSGDVNAASYLGPGKFLYVPTNNPYVYGNSDLRAILSAAGVPVGAGAGSGNTIHMEDWLTSMGPRIETFLYNDYQLTTGLKGGIGDTSLAWNVFGSYGQTNMENDEHNNVNLPALENILYGTAGYVGSDGSTCQGYAWNPLGGQPVSKGCLEYANGTAKNNNLITQKYFEADLSGNLWQLPAGPLKFALGADYRGDSFDYQADPSLNPAFNVMPAGIPADVISPSYDLISSAGGTQNVREAYVELRAPLLTDKPFAKELSVDVAGRHSQYDLFGGANTWKADLHWQMTDAVAFRGGYERAFRAPSLQDLYNPTVQAQDSLSVDPCNYNSSYRTGPNAAQVTALCTLQSPAAGSSSFNYGLQSANGIYKGNSSLKPEVADTYSFGFVLTPHFDAPLARDLGASVDYYHIKIKGAVAGATLNSIVQNCFNVGGSNPSYSDSNFYCQQITRDPGSGAIVLAKEFSLNIGSYLTEGVDVEGHWGFALRDLGLPESAGRVMLQTYISYLRSLQISGVPGVPNIDFAGSIGDTQTAIQADGTTVSDISHPKWKANSMLGYTVGPVGGALHWRYLSAMQDLMDGPGSGDPGVSAYSYFDLDVNYQVTSQIQLTGGLTNLFNKQPPRVAGASLLTDAATYDVMGRTYYVGIKANID